MGKGLESIKRKILLDVAMSMRIKCVSSRSRCNPEPVATFLKPCFYCFVFHFMLFEIHSMSAANRGREGDSIVLSDSPLSLTDKRERKAERRGRLLPG